MIDQPHEHYVPLHNSRDPSKAGLPLTPLEAHQKRLARQGQRPLDAEEIARIYPKHLEQAIG